MTQRMTIGKIIPIYSNLLRNKHNVVYKEIVKKKYKNKQTSKSKIIWQDKTKAQAEL